MPRLPPRSANAEEIRSYIRQTLTTKYHADQSLADEAALSWRIGRGSELHDVPLNYFQQVFGVDVGLCLYQSVCEDLHAAWEQSRVGIACDCKFKCHSERVPSCRNQLSDDFFFYRVALGRTCRDPYVLYWVILSRSSCLSFYRL
jgi:hypothetical protein